MIILDHLYFILPAIITLVGLLISPHVLTWWEWVIIVAGVLAVMNLMSCLRKANLEKSNDPLILRMIKAKIKK
jgi:threonine/homoserine efflux transporter RhtA